jgi:hypothetical protein
MLEKLKHLLSDLESRVDPERQHRIIDLHRNALNWEEVERLPLVITFPYPTTSKYYPFPHREIFDNPEKMLFNELVHAFNTSIWLHGEIGDDLPYTIRANFGTVVIASIFGARIEQREDNPPWVRSYDSLDEFENIFSNDPQDFSRGYATRVVDTYRFYKQVLADYPNLQKCLRIVLPDLQGPLDNIELLRGSEIFSDFILNPELVDKGLRLMANVQVGFAKYLMQFTTDGPENYSHQHAFTIKGNILIRNDSAIMVSPEIYARQVAPHDEFVLHEMNGGGIHSCGKIDFIAPEILRLPSIKCLDFGESWLNELDDIYYLASKRKIPLTRIRVNKNDLLSGKIYDKYPTGVSLNYNASSFEEAQFIRKSFYDNRKLIHDK